MSPEEIIQAYDVLAQDVGNDTAQKAAQIGNSQRSLGGLAEAVATPSGQTSGLANYTYNRTLRPIVDASTAALTTQGKAQALQTKLTNELLAAKQRYEDAKNAYTVASTTPKTTNSNNIYGEQSDDGVTTRFKDESTGDRNAPSSTANGISAQDSFIANANAYAALTGGGQLPESPKGTKFSYTLNGSTHTGYVYPGAGGEIDGVSFTRSGLNNHLNNVMQQGATFQNYLGNDTNYSIWKIANKIY